MAEVWTRKDQRVSHPPPVQKARLERRSPGTVLRDFRAISGASFRSGGICVRRRICVSVTGKRVSTWG